MIPTVGVKRLSYLYGEFTCGCQYQCLRSTKVRLQVFDDRPRESCRLAGPCLGLRDNIGTLKHATDRPRLDRCWLLVS